MLVTPAAFPPSAGVHPSRIIFAHPCKRPCDIRYAREQGIDYTTFDTESELHKIAALHPGFKLVLRIRADDPDARVPLGLKYGCLPEEAAGLLATAQSLGLNVVGVSFHVGSACKNLAAYSGAIEKARMVRTASAPACACNAVLHLPPCDAVAGAAAAHHCLLLHHRLFSPFLARLPSSPQIFDTATAMGYEMELLDIGGGFTGHFDSHGNVMFGDIANAINSAIAAHFPPESGVRIISEPGRYFAETASTLLTPIYGQRDRVNKEGVPTKEYWLTDGLYGSFNCIIYDGQNPTYEVRAARAHLTCNSSCALRWLCTASSSVAGLLPCSAFEPACCARESCLRHLTRRPCPCPCRWCAPPSCPSSPTPPSTTAPCGAPPATAPTACTRTCRCRSCATATG